MQTVLKHLPVLVGLIASAAVSAQTILHVDASAPARAPLENTLKMGASVSPSGERRSRLSDEYWERQRRLEKELEQARARLDDALARWNALR